MEDLRTLADQWQELEDELADAHADDQMDEVQDLRAQREKYTELCNELGCDPTPDGLRTYGDSFEPTLIRESEFKDYARELAEDIGAIDRNANWPLSCIDWEQAANELRVDYTSISFDGTDYLMRSV